MWSRTFACGADTYIISAFFSGPRLHPVAIRKRKTKRTTRIRSDTPRHREENRRPDADFTIARIGHFTIAATHPAAHRHAPRWLRARPRLQRFVTLPTSTNPC